MGKGRRLAAAMLGAILLALAGPAKAQEKPAQGDAAQELETLQNEGRYPEAVTLLQQQIATLQEGGQLETPIGAALLNNLGELHYKLGRHGEAVPLYERALAISDRQMQGPNPQSAVTWRNLGVVYQLTGRPMDAYNAYLRSAAIFQAIPGAQVQLASTLNNFATLLQDARRFGEAEQVLMRVLGIYQQSFGQTHPYVGTAYNNLGQLYRKGGDLARAEFMLTAANRLAAQNFGPDHPQRVPFLRGLGMVHVDKSDWARAVPLLREAFEITRKQVRRGAASRGELSGAELDPGRQREIAGDFINASMKLMMADQSQGVALARDVFLAGQWRPNQTAASLLQMAARRMTGDGPLERLVRRRQDLVAEWQAIQKRTAEVALKGSEAAAPLRADIARLAEIDKTLASIDATIAGEFPGYAELTDPAPLDVPAVQGLLREDEALALFIETGSPSWVWVITKTEKSLSLLNMSSQALAREVAALRCGLDLTHWVDPAKWPEETPAEVQAKEAQRRIYDRCMEAGGKPEGASPPRFDLQRAHSLYKAFFGASEGALRGKHLIVVPSASLMQLPFAALVTAPPSGGDLRKARWLGTSAPLSVLPSLSSLSALRRSARPSKAAKPYLGIGNPLLTGSASSPQHRALAEMARARQACPERPAGSAPEDLRLAAAHLQPAEAFRGSLADVAVLKAQLPLPETADELCEVAASLQAPSADVLLGDKAREASFKERSNAGWLEAYRILHFATHGLIAGNLPGLAEPALMLTPPEAATDQDDGLLTASEIARARLDADWVVLSACNTAAGGAEGAEALSGLTRAFFYAGARALLVTHWEINSAAAVKLTTGAFGAMQRDARLSQAEAMRQSMAALVADTAIPNAAHPSIWAAFALVGDGGRRQINPR